MKIKDLPKYDITKKESKTIEKILADNPRTRSALIPILQQIQEKIGFLPVEVQRKVADSLQISEKDVYGVVTFYSFFTMIPRGRNNIRVCMGTACYVKGGKKIVDSIQTELKIKPGQTTQDRKYSLQINRCLGACGIAPIVVINDKVYQKVDPAKVMDIVYSYD